MASSSGNSSGSGRIGSEEDLKGLMDQRKRRRMESNRESARRSRMRKQKHVDELTVQIDHLKNENTQIMTRVSITTQQSLSVENENVVLKTQMMELSHRLDSLNEILGYINNNNNNNNNNNIVTAHNNTINAVSEGYNDGFMNNSWNLMYANQPILMANDDFFQY